MQGAPQAFEQAAVEDAQLELGMGFDDLQAQALPGAQGHAAFHPDFALAELQQRLFLPPLLDGGADHLVQQQILLALLAAELRRLGNGMHDEIGLGDGRHDIHGRLIVAGAAIV